MSLVWGATRIVTRTQEVFSQSQHGVPLVVLHNFIEAYLALRASVKEGDLRIHVSVEGTREEVGVEATAEVGGQ